MNAKPKVIKDYEKLPPEILEQIKLFYPFGFENKLITFKNAKGAFVSALPFESDQFHYLVRMTKSEAQEIIQDDDDYDDDGNLKDDVADELNDKHDTDTIVTPIDSDVDVEDL